MLQFGLKRSIFVVLTAVLFGTGCREINDLLEPYGSNDKKDDVALLFTMTNEATSNEVLAYYRLDDGQLKFIDSYDAGGVGSGARTDLPIGRDPLTSQDAVVLSPNEKYLYVVNAGSNSVAAFAVNDGHLRRVGVYPSHGTLPVSIAISPDGAYLYVLNNGGAGTDILPNIMDDGTTGSIQGYAIHSDGSLQMIEGSNQPMSGEISTKGTIDFDPYGKILAATEFGPVSNIVSYVVEDGIAGEPNVFNTKEGSFEEAGDDPFGGEFDQYGFFHTANLELTPDGPAPGQATASTYSFDDQGQLRVVNAAIPTNGTASCWLELSPDNRYAYTVNTDNRTISGFAVGSNGMLTPLTSNSIVAITGDQEPTVGTSNAVDALDITFTKKYAYNLIPIQGSIQIWKVEENGALSLEPSSITNVPFTAQGIAATGDDGP